ncbi:carboxymuconolactone decarboxylase family protein [Sphingobium sufflavum]|uniref:carboxymuconolactone decarboxylase family protein n=1 Tax=Sphingobium sufflavum TaxID=1129547 RepID=UPI001F24247A|nr:carboxymuconolactone decarboxylase family protein [Sphingobium sufflavum]MCE7795011.1 carboxymuconolactone decarboxylase family protein [Sphingobium sufflavum]
MPDTTPPRIPNLPRDQWTDPAREVFSFWGEPGSWENGSRTNIQMVMANHPPLGRAFNIFGKHLLLDSTVPVRARELIVLRTSWHLKAEYEWHYHVGYALKAGLTLAEVAGIGEGPDAAVWDDREEDRAVLRAVDELVRDSRISDATWATLSRSFSKEQLMDMVFTIGHYVMLSWSIAAFGIPLEEGVDRIGFDLRTASGQTPGVRFRPGETDDWAEG